MVFVDLDIVLKIKMARHGGPVVLKRDRTLLSPWSRIHELFEKIT